jgi:ABC-type spermidine/putrescine transport system permease subunit I
LVLPGVLYLLLFYVWPLVTMVTRSFTEPSVGLDNYVAVVTSTLAQRSLVVTLQTAVSVTVLCLVLAYPLAYLLTLAPPRVAGVLLTLVLISLWLNVVSRTFAWQVLLRDTGIINQLLTGAGLIERPIPLIRTPWGVAIGMTHVLLPTMILPIYVVMARIDPELGRAAANLGASPLASFFKIFLPLSLPGVLAGCLLVFVLALGFYITPVLLGGGGYLMIGQLVVQNIRLLQWGYGSALAVVLLLAAIATLAISARVARPATAILEA